MNKAEPARLHCSVHGRVQGVGYRIFVQAAAVRLGLRGWVRNRADGCVEVLARGAPAAIAEFKQLLRTGPPAARVEALRELPDSAGKAEPRLESEFRIAHEEE